MLTRIRLACVALLLLAAGCEGPAGEPGATGLQGPRRDTDARETRPLIFSVSPDVVSTNTIVTITGANFDPDGGNEIWVDGFAAQLVESSPTSLKVTGLAPESPKEKFSALTVISRGETSNSFMVHVVPWGYTRSTRLPVPSGWSASVLLDKTPGRETVRLFEHDGAILDIDVRSGTSTLVAPPGTLPPYLQKAKIGADGRTYALIDNEVVAIEGSTFWPREYQSWGADRLRDFAVGTDGSVYGLTDWGLDRMIASGDRMTVYSEGVSQVQVTSERVYLLTGSGLLVYSTSDHSLLGEIPVPGDAFALTSDAIVIFHGFPQTGSVFDLTSLEHRRDLSGLPSVNGSAGGQVLVADDAWIFDRNSRLELVEDPFGEGKKSDAMLALASCSRDVTRGSESSSVWIANYGTLFEVSAPDVAQFFLLERSFDQLAAAPSGALYLAGGGWDIQRFDPGNRTSESIPSDAIPGYSTGGIVSPLDGSVYYAFRDGDADGIAMYDEERDESRVITNFEAYIDRASFAAFGETLFFLSDGDLWTVPMSGGPPNRETSGGLARFSDSMETSKAGHVFWNTPYRLVERSPSGDMRWIDSISAGGGIVMLPTEELLFLSCEGPALIVSR